MKKCIFKLLLMCFALVFFRSASGQSAYISKSVGPGGDADVSDSLYIGPGPHFIDGPWDIYSQYVLIDENATFVGTGKISFLDPGLFSGVSSSTKLDANGNVTPIDVNLELQNSNTVVLTNLNFPADLLAFGFAETATSTLYVGEDLNFASDGAHLVLDPSVAGNLRLESDATLSGYRPARHIVTNNSILSHVIKESFTSAFTFPVGISGGDYTPAQITNASNNTVSVSVQDYTNSLSPEALADGTAATADGMNRTWHIFAGTSGISSTINLQHNSTSNQTGFVDATHFVTQWGNTIPNSSGDVTVPFSTSPWQSNTTGAGALGTLSTGGSVAGSSMRSRTYSSGLATSSAANQSYFSKSSDASHPLPVVLNDFSVQANKCDVVVKWNSGSENNNSNFRLEHSTNGKDYETIYNVDAKGSNSAYSFVHTNAPAGVNLYRLAIQESVEKLVYTGAKMTKTDCGAIFSEAFVRIYPNPSDGVFSISGLTDNKFVLRVMNIQGQIVREQNTTGDKELVDITDLAAGPYVLQLLQGDEVKLNVKVTKN